MLALLLNVLVCPQVRHGKGLRKVRPDGGRRFRGWSRWVDLVN